MFVIDAQYALCAPAVDPRRPLDFPGSQKKRKFYLEATM